MPAALPPWGRRERRAPDSAHHAVRDLRYGPKAPGPRGHGEGGTAGDPGGPGPVRFHAEEQGNTQKQAFWLAPVLFAFSAPKGEQWHGGRGPWDTPEGSPRRIQRRDRAGVAPDFPAGPGRPRAGRTSAKGFFFLRIPQEGKEYKVCRQIAGNKKTPPAMAEVWFSRLPGRYSVHPAGRELNFCDSGPLGTSPSAAAPEGTAAGGPCRT